MWPGEDIATTAEPDEEDDDAVMSKRDLVDGLIAAVSPILHAVDFVTKGMANRPAQTDFARRLVSRKSECARFRH